MLKDVYKFYKNSSKRKKNLETTTCRKDKVLDEFINTLVDEVRIGKEDLKKIPSLQLKKWNATRWLGRSACLVAMCKAYERILEHLSDFSKLKSETPQSRQTAADLYEKLTSFDIFLFIFLYRDLASTLAIFSKLLQAKDIGVREVGCIIISLHYKLMSNYPEESVLPTELIADGTADEVMCELFGDDKDTILQMEDNLQPQNPVEMPVESSTETGHTTHKRDVSSAYASILSKKARDEWQREMNMELDSVLDQSETEVISCISSKLS